MSRYSAEDSQHGRGTAVFEDGDEGGDGPFIARIKRLYGNNAATTGYFFGFLAARGFQFVLLITIIGISSYWISEIGMKQLTAPEYVRVLIGFSVTAALMLLFVVWVACFGQIIAMALLASLDVMFIIVYAVYTVKFSPIAYAHCATVASTSHAEQATNATAFTNSLNTTMHWNTNFGQDLRYWYQSSASQCALIFTTWVFCLILAILYFVSLVFSGYLVFQRRKVVKLEDVYRRKVKKLEDEYRGENAGRAENGVRKS